MFEKLFKLKERKTSIGREIFAGLIAFATILYILPTNADILSEAGMSMEGNFAITALLSFALCIAMGLISNYPLVVSTGMGVNTILAVTICKNFGFSWQEGMIMVAVVGILLLILTVTKLRDIIINSIPKDLKTLLSVGIGMFLALVGLASAKIVDFSSGLPSLGNLSDPGVIIPFVGIFLGISLLFVKNKLISSLAIPITILVCAIVSVSVNYGIYAGTAANLSTLSSDWGITGVKEVVFLGYFGSTPTAKSFTELLANVFTNPYGYVGIATLLFIAIFNATSVSITVGKGAGLVDANGNPQNFTRIAVVDSVGNIFAGAVGTSITTPFAESNVGVSYGGRTGLMAITCGFLFLLSAFIYPVFSLFSSWSAVAPGLVVVGATIVGGSLKEVDLKDYRFSVIAFFMMIFMILTYSIVYGLGIGIIFYVLINLVSGRRKENNLCLYILALLFIGAFVVEGVLRVI